MADNLLSFVQELEAEAERLLSDARAQAQRKSTEAEASAQALAGEIRAAGALEAAEIARREHEALQGKLGILRGQEQERLETLLSEARSRLEGAVDRVLAKLRG